jgi:glycosyltransferase involved in cell wall biosynthesis
LDESELVTLVKGASRDRISVCICTFKRPDLLARLLEALARQVRDPLFSFDVVVVDNDKNRSAEAVVRTFRDRQEVPAFYDCEPDQNISLARNRAIRNASGNLVAFLDDDEYPCADWLASLYRTLKTYNAHGVLGPVLPDLAPEAPDWLRRGKFLDRRRLRTGAQIGGRDARTGNLLVQRSLFTERNCWFDPIFGRTGGEDTDFFRRQFDSGAVFVWCDEALAYEAVPPERWNAAFYVKRYLRSGTVDGELVRAGKYPGTAVIARQALILCGATLVTPFAFLLPKHIWVRTLQKVSYCCGIIAAYWGLSLLRFRD